MFRPRRAPCGWAIPILLAAGSAILVSTSVARADHLDEELIRRAPKMMKVLRDKGYQNVGVHTFELKRGDAKASFQGGLINTNMASRVENALVLALNPEEKPIGIIKDASSNAAAKLKSASYRSAQDRAKLFGIEYPLAWGMPPKVVSADAFLVGRVTLSSDLKKTIVLVAAFDRKDPSKMVKLDEFEVATDRYILTDAGQGFTLSKGKGGFRRGMSDEDIFASITEDDKAKKEAKTTPPPADPKTGAVPPAQPKENPVRAPDSRPPNNRPFFPVALQVFYNDVEQAFASDPDASGLNNWTMRDPRQGEKVSFRLRNVSDQTIGVVLTVNGISTLYEETGQPDQMTRWVLEPNKDYTIKGFYQKDQKTFIEIEGLPEDLSREKFQDLGGAARAGLIHLHVFRVTDNVAQAGGAPAFSRSMRSVSKPVLAKSKPQTPFELQALVVQNANVKGGRGLMAWGAGEGKEDLQEKTLGKSVLTDTMVIRYFKLP